MVSKLIINDNTFGSQAEATTYLADSPRTTSWATLPTTKKDQCLLSATREIEKLKFQGDKTEVQVVDTIVVNAGGSGYVLSEVITVSNGVGGSATATVLTVSGGAVLTLQLTDAGLYSTNPGASAEATTASLIGTGLTVDLTFKDQPLAFPRIGLTDLEGDAVDSATVPQVVKDAQYELAYLLSQDSTIEGSTGTSENNKRLKAGSVEVERFSPTKGTRLPNVVHELLRSFLEGFGSMTSVFSSGVTVESQFDDDDRYSVTAGIP